MKFDIIISNPPYNKDMYLDFVEAAYNLLTDTGMAVFITPAKFYAKGGSKNQAFREKIMPHIKEVHVYKDSTDVFDIAEQGGIAYYSIYKNQTFASKLIKNYSGGKYSPGNDELRSELEEHTEQPTVFMPKKCLSLINKILTATEPLYDVTTDDNPVKKMYYCSDTQVADTNEDGPDRYPLLSGVGGTLKPQGYIYHSSLKRTDRINTYKVICNEQMGSGSGGKASVLGIDKQGLTYGDKSPAIIEPNTIPKGSYIILHFADTLTEAYSFASYIDSQLVNFTKLMSFVANKANSKENWRHVPALPTGYKFDHIYTNEEIFKIFELTSEEIQLITNLIKPRKENILWKRTGKLPLIGTTNKRTNMLTSVQHLDMEYLLIVLGLSTGQKGVT